MSGIKKGLFFRIVSIALILSFIGLDISWAYPGISSEKLNHTLAVRGTMFQNTGYGDVPIVQVDQIDLSLRASVLGLIDYHFEQGKRKKLPLKHVESSANLEELPFRKGVNDEQDGIPYGLVEFNDTKSELTIPCTKDGQDYLIVISPCEGNKKTVDPWGILGDIEGYKLSLYAVTGETKTLVTHPENIPAKKNKKLTNAADEQKKPSKTNQKKNIEEPSSGKIIRGLQIVIIFLMAGMYACFGSSPKIRRCPLYLGTGQSNTGLTKKAEKTDISEQMTISTKTAQIRRNGTEILIDPRWGAIGGKNYPYGLNIEGLKIVVQLNLNKLPRGVVQLGFRDNDGAIDWNPNLSIITPENGIAEYRASQGKIDYNQLSGVMVRFFGLDRPANADLIESIKLVPAERMNVSTKRAEIRRMGTEIFVDARVGVVDGQNYLFGIDVTNHKMVVNLDMDKLDRGAVVQLGFEDFDGENDLSEKADIVTPSSSGRVEYKASQGKIDYEHVRGVIIRFIGLRDVSVALIKSIKLVPVDEKSSGLETKDEIKPVGKVQPVVAPKKKIIAGMIAGFITLLVGVSLFAAEIVEKEVTGQISPIMRELAVIVAAVTVAMVIIKISRNNLNFKNVSVAIGILVIAGMTILSPVILRGDKNRLYTMTNAIAGTTEVMNISTRTVKIQSGGKEIFVDTRWGAVDGNRYPSGIDVTNSKMVVKLDTNKLSRGTTVQLGFKDDDWASDYDPNPVEPDSNGIVEYNPYPGEINHRNTYGVIVKFFGLGQRASADLIKSMQLVPIGAKKTVPSAKSIDAAMDSLNKTVDKLDEAIVSLTERVVDNIKSKKTERKPAPKKKTPHREGTTFENVIKVPLNVGWKAQGWHDTQAVKKVYYDKDAGVLVGEVVLEANHETNDRGELIVDVYKLGLRPFDFTKVRIEADVKVVVDKGRFGGTPKAPDGVGIFVKTGDSQGWTNMYDWENLPPDEVGTWKRIGLDLREATKRDLVYRDSSFPSERGENPIIQKFGVKIGAGSGTGSKIEKGRILVRNVEIIPLTQVATVPAPKFWPEVPKQTKGGGIINIPADAGWTFRDMKGNKAVTAVYVKGDVIAFKVKFKGGDPFGDYNKGSMYLSLYDNDGKLVAKVPGLPEFGFFDMTKKILRAKIWTTGSFAEGKTIPSAIVPGAKDWKFKYQNGAWQPGLITRQRTKRWDDGISYYPSDPRENNPGWTDDDFVVKKGKEILIKAGLPGATDSSYAWEGWIYVSDVRFEPDRRTFPDAVPSLIWIEPLAQNPVDKLPVSKDIFKEWSGGSGYGLFDRDLTAAGLKELDRKLSLMGPEAKTYRLMALYGSLPTGGAIAFDGDDMPLGFSDPKTGEMGMNPLDKLPTVLERIDKVMESIAKYDKNLIIVFLAHDFADGMKMKENRGEGDRPSLFTDSAKFAKFLELQDPILDHLHKKWRDRVVMLELINEPLNMDTTLVPIPFIQQRVHEFNMRVHRKDPTWLVSIGMRDTKSWGYFAHMTQPKFMSNGVEVTNPYYKQYVPQSHWYADKEEDTPIATNVGKFFMPSYSLGWLKGELDPREPAQYQAAYGVYAMLEKIYESACLGALFWMDREGEFWPDWRKFTDFMRNTLPKMTVKSIPSGVSPSEMHTKRDSITKGVKKIGREQAGFNPIDGINALFSASALVLGAVSGKLVMFMSLVIVLQILYFIVNKIASNPQVAVVKNDAQDFLGNELLAQPMLTEENIDGKSGEKSNSIIAEDKQTMPPVDESSPVKYSINNRLSKMVDLGKKIIKEGNINDKSVPLERESTAVEIKAELKKIMKTAELKDSALSNKDTAEDVARIKKEITHLEVDGIVASALTMAMRTKDDEKILMGFETDWIPEPEEKGFGQAGTKRYVKSICSVIKKELVRRGLGGRVKFVHKDRESLATELLNIKNDGKTKISDVIILASNSTIEKYSKQFDELKNERGKRPFITKIDPSDIEAGEAFDGKVYTAKIMEMLSITLELAVSGRDLRSNLSMVKSYDAVLRVLELIPKIRRVDYNECLTEYECKLEALRAA